MRSFAVLWPVGLFDALVVAYRIFRSLLDELLGVTWITPHVEAPRCQCLRDL